MADSLQGPSSTVHFPAGRIPHHLQLSAATRLVSEGSGPRGHAARRLITAAALHGIDLTLLWGTFDAGPDGRPARVRQVCLVVPGAGRSASIVLSGPGAWPEAQEEAERIAALNAACKDLANPNILSGRHTRLAQALPEPAESWAVRAYLGASFVKVGDLAYLRRPLGGPLPAAPVDWPAGIAVRPMSAFAADRSLLLTALERSYLDTLDCPELCGLRETTDILESHRATGSFNPALWWLVFMNDEPHGCLLLSHAPEHRAVELVYLGLSPQLRAKGVGTRLMNLGLSHLKGIDADSVTCAVDLRNAPAIRLYQRCGFREVSRRVALVRPI